MKKNGFTLVELLAVVILISLLAVIITSRITSPVNKSKKSTYYASTTSLIKRLEEYYFEQKLKGTLESCTFNFEENNNTCNDFKIGGTLPTKGIINLDELGNINGNITFEDEYTFNITNNKIEEQNEIED